MKATAIREERLGRGMMVKHKNMRKDGKMIITEKRRDGRESKDDERHDDMKDDRLVREETGGQGNKQ